MLSSISAPGQLNVTSCAPTCLRSDGEMFYVWNMAYKFDIETDLDAPFSDNQSTEIVEFTLGFDVERDVAIIMSVMLVPIDEAHDIRFGLRERSLSHEWKVSGPDFTIDAVRTYIPREQRGQVLQHLVAAIRLLIAKVEPDNVTMETYYAKLAPDALKKYDHICSAMHDCHYITADQFRDETSLKDHWLFKRRA